MAEYVLEVGRRIGVVHAELEILFCADAILDEVTGKVERLAHEVARHASAHGHLRVGRFELYACHGWHVGCQGKCFQIGRGRHVADTLDDSGFPFQDGTVVHDGWVVLVLVATKDVYHFPVGIGREDVLNEAAVMGHVDVVARIFLQRLIEEVGHLRAVDATLAGELLDERCADEIVEGHVELRRSGASRLCLLAVQACDVHGEVHACAFRQARVQACLHDGGLARGKC